MIAMEPGGQHNGKTKFNGEGLTRTLNPRLFQLPNSRKRVPVTIKAPQSLSSEEFPPLPSNRKTSPPVIQRDDEGSSDSPIGDQRHPDSPQRTVPVSNGHSKIEVLPPGGPVTEPPKWRPDVFVPNFVSKACSEINNAPAIQIVTNGARDVNYTAYISNFASPLFLPPRNVLKAPPMSSLPLVPVDQIDSQNYEKNFNDCVLMDWTAEVLGLQTYDLFGVPLNVLNSTLQTFTLHVPGLRENTPRVVYGDTVLLRQLLFEPGSSIPRGMDYWINHGGRQRGTSS